MNDENDIPLHPSADEVVEARIVAWVLGEASAFEIAELERLCAEKPELAAFHQRMLALQGLLGEAVGHETGDEWKLPEAKAKTVHEAFGEVPFEAVVEKKKRPLWKRPQPWIGVAACLAVSTVVWRYHFAGIGEKYVLRESDLDLKVPAAEEGWSYNNIEELQRAIQRQEDKVEEYRKTLSNIVREKGIVYAGNESIFRSGSGNVDGSSRASADAYAKLEKNKIELESQIKSLLQHDVDQSIVIASGLDLPENIVKTLYPSYLEVKRDLDAAKNQGSGESQAKIQELRTRAESMRKDLEQGVVSLRDVLRAKHQMAEANLEKMGDLKVAKRDEAMKRGLDTQDYVEAKQQFEQELDLLQRMKLGLVRDQVESKSMASAPSGVVSGGRRSGNAEIARNNIDALLNAPASPAAPAPVTAAPADPAIAAQPRAGRTRTVPPEKPASSFNSTNFESGKPAEVPVIGAVFGKGEKSKDADPVRRSLYMAEGNYNLGKYDDARKDYEEALRADPSNSAARRGLERLATAKSDYYRAAYDHTRAELLMEVDKAWELDVPKLEKQQEEIDLFAKAAAPDGASDSRVEVDASYEVPGQRFAMNLNGNRGVGEAMGYSMADNLNNLGKLENDLKPGEPAIDGLAYRFQDEGRKIGDDMITQGQDTVPADGFYDLEEKPVESLPLQWVEGFNSDFGGSIVDKDEPTMGTVALAQKAPVDLNEIATADEAFSTFSLNVSDVSFQLALASLEKSESPDPASIKVEQFYNAVDYGDPAPSGDPIAAKIEQSAHPVIPGRNLVRLGVKTASAGRSAAQPLNLTLLIDQSGSMVRDDRRAALEKALADLSTLLTEKDRVSVIGFSRTPSLLADGIAGNQLGGVTGMMNREAAESGTNLEEALSLAQQIALRQASHGAGNRIVLFTDGAANLGDADPARLAEKVRTLRQEGVAFDVAGIGADGLNDKLLAELARNGDGRYLLAAGNIAAQLAGAFRPAAEDVKVQVRFNPERVSRYKLIGFEEDRLKKEDFRNDAVDAAELAAEEAAVALYQVELIPDGKGEIGEMSVRFRDAASGEMVERSWTIAHDANTPVFDKATPSMQLAGLSMLAGEKLKGGPMAPMIDFRKYNGGIASVRQYYSNSSKVADMLRMIGLLAR